MKSSNLKHRIKETDLGRSRFNWERLRESLEQLAISRRGTVLEVTSDDSLYNISHNHPNFLAIEAAERWAKKKGIFLLHYFDANHDIDWRHLRFYIFPHDGYFNE